MRTPNICLCFAALAAVVACGSVRSAISGDSSFRDQVRTYLTRYELAYQQRYIAWQESRWDALTHIVPGDSESRARVIAAESELAAFTGSIENIELSRTYLDRRRELPVLEQRELQRIAWLAVGTGQIADELVRQRIALQADASMTLHGFRHELDGRRSSLGELDRILDTETDLARRRAAWDASREPGRIVRESLVDLRWLRNEIVRALGASDFFAWRVAEYGLSAGDMLLRIDQILRDLRPLQIELHTWARYELAARYGQPVPDLIPAHWLPGRFGEDWSPLAGADASGLDARLARTDGAEDARAIVQRAETTWTRLGFEPLPQAFWDRSSIAPVPDDAGFVKAVGPSAWHVDLDRDVRVLMSVEHDARGYGIAHRMLGFAQYQLQTANPAVPYTLRRGASRAFEESVGALVQFAAEQPRFLASAGLGPSPDDAAEDPMHVLLAQALQYVTLVPWSAGTMTQYEKEIYRNELPAGRWNARFWELAAKYQGIAPPSPRDERWCDAAADPDLVDQPGDSYDHALACVMLFQLHDHIARKILNQDEHATDYWNRREVGDFLKSIMRFGATVDARAKLREKTGYDLSARAMVDYFEPLRRWLAEQNAGRTRTLEPY